MVGHLLPVEEVDIAESPPVGPHGTEQAIVDVFLDVVHRGRIAGQPEILGAILHPGHSHAGLHHAVDVGIALLHRGVAPAFAVEFRPPDIGPAVADDGYLLLADFLEILVQAVLPLLLAGGPVIFSQSLPERGHLIGLGIGSAHLAQGHAAAYLFEHVAGGSAARVDDVGGEVEIVLVSGEIVKPHERLQQGR